VSELITLVKVLKNLSYTIRYPFGCRPHGKTKRQTLYTSGDPSPNKERCFPLDVIRENSYIESTYGPMVSFFPFF